MVDFTFFGNFFSAWLIGGLTAWIVCRFGESLMDMWLRGCELIGKAIALVVPPFLNVISKIVDSALTPILIILTRSETICAKCFRYSAPLNAKYETGTRRCEHCNWEIEKRQERGKVISVFGDSLLRKEGRRDFVSFNPDFTKKEYPVDISEVHIDTKTANRRLLEIFITYIINHPPKYGLKSVRIFYKGDLDDLGRLKNLILNNFKTVRGITSK
jgi:hypothetical protein